MSTFKLFFLVFILFLISCRTEHEGDCLNYVSSPVTQVSMLDSGIINQPINIDFHFNANNGCGNFYNFNVNTIGDTIVISPVVKYEGCVCTMIFQNLQTTYSYTPTHLGYAYFKFPQSDSSFLMDSIYIQP